MIEICDQNSNIAFLTFLTLYYISGNNTYTCECSPGLTGENCRYIDYCFDKEPCKNGVCVPKNDDYTCECDDSGYSGQHCEEDLDECLQADICGSAGTCTNTIGSFECTCEGMFKKFQKIVFALKNCVA